MDETTTDARPLVVVGVDGSPDADADADADAALRHAADVPVDVVARLGRPTPVLTDAARGAALLVVGHRGRGPLRSAQLGSVGLGCVLHAPRPVTVVSARPAGATTVPPARTSVAAAP